MKNLLLPFFLFLFLLSVSVKAQEPEDSVVVVKGQVSDYTITLKKKKFRTGQVLGPDGKLYNCITVNGETNYNFRGLDKRTTYYFAIEALGESGRSEMGKEVEVKRILFQIRWLKPTAKDSQSFEKAKMFLREEIILCRLL